ncbi:MAG: DsbA family protein [Anaerolineales bacterium]|jgi:protein-disulfide isomerase
MSKRADKIAQNRKQRSQRRLIGLFMIIGGALIIAALLIWPSLNATQDINVPAAREYPFADGTSLGSPDAPVVIEDYSDFLCSHCRDFDQSTLPQIIANYVSTGQVRIEFRQFPILGSGSTVAANASLCAAEQNRFWQYTDLLFANQTAANFSSARLIAFAESLNLDRDQFSSCLDEGRYNTRVDAEFTAGRDRGVNSTPTFFINGQELVGAAPYVDFQQVIDSALQLAD